MHKNYSGGKFSHGLKLGAALENVCMGHFGLFIKFRGIFWSFRGVCKVKIGNSDFKINILLLKDNNAC